jgi:methylmalonyl-CoA carboxyltransferase large subunit
VIKEVTGEEITAEQLGGVESHAQYSGVVHFVAENDREAIDLAKRLLALLPSNNTEEPPIDPVGQAEATLAPDPLIEQLVPEDPSEPYDMYAVIRRLVDRGDFLAVQERFAPNLIVGFGRLAGRCCGFVANQPLVRAGTLDINSADKAARFVRFCNAFNIPLVSLVDVPGFLPGINQEYGGIIRHGAKMLFAFAASTVPKQTVVLRKAYGGAFLAMCSKDLGADRVYAWPSAEIAVMGAEGAVNILYRKEIEEAPDSAAERQRRIDEYRLTFANPFVAAGRGYLDDVISPSETRACLIAGLEVLRSKRELRPQKTHGLIPM